MHTSRLDKTYNQLALVCQVVVPCGADTVVSRSGTLCGVGSLVRVEGGPGDRPRCGGDLAAGSLVMAACRSAFGSNCR